MNHGLRDEGYAETIRGVVSDKEAKDSSKRDRFLNGEVGGKIINGSLS